MYTPTDLAASCGTAKPMCDLTYIDHAHPLIWQSGLAQHPRTRDDEYYLDQLISAVWKSPLVCEGFRYLKAERIGIAFSTLHEGHWVFDDDTSMLLFQRPSRFLRQTSSAVFDDVAMALIEGLAFLLVQGGPDLSHLTLRHRVLAERARTAHADLLVVRMCWELKAAGITGLWRFMRTGLNHDLVDVFADVLDRSPIVATACRSAFLQWFKNPERIARCDMATLSMIDRDYSEGLKVTGQEKLGPMELLRLTRDPNGPTLYRSIFASILQHKTFSMMTDPMAQAYLKQIERDIEFKRTGGLKIRDVALAKRLFPETPLS